MKKQDVDYWFIAWATVGLFVVVGSALLFPEAAPKVAFGWIINLFN